MSAEPSDSNRSGLESARVAPRPVSRPWIRGGLGHFYPGNVALLLFKFEMRIFLTGVI